MVTRQHVADMIARYVHGDLTLRGLVDWAERLFIDEPFEAGHEQAIAEVAGYLAGTDMPDMFPLTPQVVSDLLQKVGYRLEVEPQPVA